MASCQNSQVKGEYKMAQSSPYYRESGPLLMDGHTLTAEEILRCQRIVIEANDPNSQIPLSPNMLRHAQLILAEAEHAHYQSLLKNASEAELKILMDGEVMERRTAADSELLIGKAINNPRDIHFSSKHFQ